MFGAQILVTLLSLCHDFGCLNINKVLMLFTVGPHGDDKDSGKEKYRCGSSCLS